MNQLTLTGDAPRYLSEVGVAEGADMLAVLGVGEQFRVGLAHAVDDNDVGSVEPALGQFGLGAVLKDAEEPEVLATGPRAPDLVVSRPCCRASPPMCRRR